MELELIEKRRLATEDRFSWYPFDENPAFTLGWWNRQPSFYDDATYTEVRRSSAEVARVELGDHVGIDHYAGVPPLGDLALEIRFIEVAEGSRRQGIGAQLVATLMKTYPDRRLVAFSEDADEFWSSLGWDRYEHPEGTVHYRPLYIQPS